MDGAVELWNLFNLENSNMTLYLCSWPFLIDLIGGSRAEYAPMCRSQFKAGFQDPRPRLRALKSTAQIEFCYGIYFFFLHILFFFQLCSSEIVCIRNI